MKKIVVLFALLIALLTIVAQGRELPPERGSDRTCYSADGTKVYSYYGEYIIVVRQIGERLSEDWEILPPGWEDDPKVIEQFAQKHKKVFSAIIEKFQLEECSMALNVYVSLKTGRYVMSDIELNRSAIALVDQLPLDYIFSLCETFKQNPNILEPDFDADANAYREYKFLFRSKNRGN